MTDEHPVLARRIWVGVAIQVSLVVLFLMTVGVGNEMTAWAVTSVCVLITVMTVGWAVYRTAKQRRAYQEQLLQWTARQAVYSERLRIAADLHDLASHGLGSITMRAAAGRLDPSAEQLLVALEEIENTSRQATTELRRMLTLLRDPEGHKLNYSPTATLAELPVLIEAAADMGLSVTSSLEKIEPLSSGAQLAIYSLVKEGLINVHKHVGPTKVSVSLTKDREQITVTVCDDGPQEAWETVTGPGYGLVGLSERFANLGGRAELIAQENGHCLCGVLPAEKPYG